jgi:two-component system response regulator AtoC
MVADHHVPEMKTVMVCDDDEDLRMVFGLALESKFKVILVNSGEKCIQKFMEEKNRGNKIHLILLDYRLGDMLGDSVARKIKEHNNGTKIILISAYDLDNKLIKELEENGDIVRYIKKPVEIANLIQIVDSTIH